MATRAQLFRAQQERSGPKKPKQPRPPRRDSPVDTAKPGVSASDRRATLPRKPVRSTEDKAVYALEDSQAGGKPSRRSTRKSSNRQKTDAIYRMKRRVSER